MNYKVAISALVLCSAMIGAAHGQEALTVDRTIDEKGRIMVVGHDEHGRGHNLLCFHSRPDDCLPLAKGQAYPTYLLPKEDALAYPVDYVTLVGSAGTGLTCSYHMFATVIIASDPKHPAVYAMISTIDEVQAAQEHYVTGRNLLCHATTQAEQYSADHSSPKEQAELAKTCKAQGHEWTSDGQCQHNQWDAASTAGDRTQQADQQTARAQQAAVPSAAAQTQAQTQEKWVAMSHTAMSITGDITLSSDKLTMGGADYPLTLVRTIDAQHLSDVGRLFDGTKPIGASLYKTNIPATAKPLKGGTICAKGAKWLLTAKGSSPYDKKPELSLASFSSDAEPNLATATESTELCATFTYVH
jgi:hypothetical protein